MDFRELYDQYHPRVRKFIFTRVKDEWIADDLTQETFLRIQRNLHVLKDSSKLSSWIFGIAANLTLDHFRNQRKPLSQECELTEDATACREMSVQKRLEQCEMGQCMQKVIRRLPLALGHVILLSDFMELSHREIAGVLHISVENVKVRLHRGRRKLKEMLEENCRFETDERNVLICEPASPETHPTTPQRADGL